MTPRPPFESHRRFTWFKPEKAFPTEYESLTVGQQSRPEEWMHVDWPVRFDDGRAPFVEDSTALRSVDWKGFRDPAGLLQRTHVATTNRQEQSLASFLEESHRQNLLSRLNPAWRDSVIGKYYAAWPFVEYGQFLALSYAVREAPAAALTFGLAYQISDKLRHGQDIVHYLALLENAVPGFSDERARDAWMNDAAFVPLREHLERIIQTRDWGEIMIAIHLVLEPLAGKLLKSELVARHAAVHGDPISPVILANAGADVQRHQQFAVQFAKFLTADPQFGESNRHVIRGWMEKWVPEGEQAAAALKPIFELEGVSLERFEDCYDRIRAGHRRIIAGATGSPKGSP